ncbi:Facilitated trehalose transporter Tret1, partial [Eumeta japonica]
MVDYMPVYFDHTAHSIDIFVVHSGGLAIIAKYVTEFDTTALEFYKSIINSDLTWCFIVKSSSKPKDKDCSGRPKIYEDAELEELLEEDSSQTKKEELALTLEVTQQALASFKSLGMIHKQAGGGVLRITGTLYRTQLMRLSRAWKEKRPQYYFRHDKIILLHDDARRHVAVPLVACMSPNFLLMDLGMAIGFPTIALPELLNAEHGLSLDDHQASWFGSVAFLCQPFGAVLSGPLVDFFGRKRATFISNIPHTIAWILMYYAHSVPTLFVANALLGLGTGVMEAPINSYVGEVSEPSVRGSMSTLTQLFCACGIFIVYFLGIAVPWRQAALICLTVPLASMLLILLVLSLTLENQMEGECFASDSHW